MNALSDSYDSGGAGKSRYGEVLKEDIKRRALFLRSMLLHPRRVGAILPTSRFAVRDLLDMADLPNARLVLEFGIGTGVYTREILARLGPDARFLAFEVDADLATAAAQRLVDHRLSIVKDSAERAEEYLAGEKANVIVCSLPFTSLPADIREDILEVCQRTLAHNGTLLVLQYSKAVLPHLNRYFARIRQRVSPLNVPPAFLFACQTAQATGEKTGERS